MRARVIAWGLVAVDLLLWVLGLVLLRLPHTQPFAEQGATSPFATAAMLGFAIVGALIVSRHPRHLVGWVYCASGLLIAAGMLSGSYLGHVLVDPAAPLAQPTEQLNGVFFWDGVLLPLTFGLLVFPDGRLPSARWRPLALLVGAVLALFSIGPATSTSPDEGVPAAAIALAVAAIVGVAASVVVRWRRAAHVEHAQLKWMTTAISILVSLLVVELILSVLGAGTGLDPSGTMGSLALTVAFMGIPAATGLAILRYRLYDIDVVIERTLVYAILTAFLGTVYVLAVIAAEALLGPLTGGNEIAVAASTLLVVALFQPVRHRIQRIVDRRFYRSRYDAERTLDAFSGRLRDEVDLDALRSEVLAVIGETMRPAHGSVWLRG